MTSRAPAVEVADRVYRYGSRYINCYLIEQGGRLTLLDAGPPAYVRRLHAALGYLGRSVRDIDAIVVTHCHVDHVGAAERVRFESTGNVFVHETDAPVVRGERKQPLPKLGTRITRPFLFRYLVGHLVPNGAARYPTVADPATFADGEKIDVPGSPRVIHTPGHTAGNSSLVLDDRGVLFSGDAIVMLDTLTGNVGPHVFEPPFTEDYERAVASAELLADVPADVMLPGHGGPWRGDVRDAVRLALRSAR